MKEMVTFACVLFQRLRGSGLPDYSSGYSSVWVDRLYRGIKRNYTGPFEFVVFTDKVYGFEEGKKLEFRQTLLDDPSLEWGCLLEPLSLAMKSENRIVIFGLDTVITGNIDAIIQTPLIDRVGLIQDPYELKEINNGIGIFPAYQARKLWIDWITRLDHWKEVALYSQMLSEMAYLRIKCNDTALKLDHEHPFQICSYKAHIRHNKSKMCSYDCRIAHFHGRPKPGSAKITEPWIIENWI